MKRRTVYFVRSAKKQKERVWYDFGTDYRHPDAGGRVDDLQEDGPSGWEGIVPFYNTYVLCQELYGNGWKFLLLLIPIYNIYFVIKMNIDWAKAFNQGVGFGIGLLLLPFIFQLILAFGGEQYRDGSYTNTQPDMVENVVNKAKDAVSGNRDDHKEQ